MRLGKASTANLSQSRAIGQPFMFVRPMIGRSGWTPGTLPRTVSYSSTRVLHHNRPQRHPRPPALAVNKTRNEFFDDKSLKSIGRRFFLPEATRM